MRFCEIMGEGADACDIFPAHSYGNFQVGRMEEGENKIHWVGVPSPEGDMITEDVNTVSL